MKKQGRKRTPEYRVWMSMRTRCRNPNHKFFHRYGGRGIIVCDRWDRFENFFSDMGSRPTPHHTLDRKDNNGPYAPHNCKWATRREQANNTPRNRIIEFRGRRLSLTQWAREIGINGSSLAERLESGWPLERALTQPSRFASRTT